MSVSETLDGRQEYFLIGKFIPKLSWEGGIKVLLRFFVVFPSGIIVRNGLSWMDE